MTPNTDARPARAAPPQRPRFALALATVLGVGYIPKAPGTFGSLVGVATAFLSSVFFLQPGSVRALFSLHPDYETVLRNELFPLPGSNVHNAMLALPILSALVLLLALGAIGVWSASRAASYAGIEDPQFVVIDEVAGKKLGRLLPPIPTYPPHISTALCPRSFFSFSCLR